MNAILIIIDSLTARHLGCYGGKRVKTPNLDRLASESARYTRAYPESLPTLQVRRALHTGRRVFPFRGHWYQKGDFRGAPGWGPIHEEYDTVAEILKANGYRTGFITDTYHQFKPSKNFQRGFDEWVWIRGQEGDNYRSGPAPAPETVARHMPSRRQDDENLRRFLARYLTNVADRKREEDYFPAQVFSEASRWLERNVDGEPFFLCVDSFDPHEPWDPPVWYRRLYDEEGDVADVIDSGYRLCDEIHTPRELQRLQANYYGEITMVDHWLGRFLDTIDRLRLREDTVLCCISDHGHNVGEHGIVGKQGHPMTREVADLVFMMRHPDGRGAGTACDALVYNMDMTAAMLARLGIDLPGPIDGVDVWPKELGGAGAERDHVTVGWGPFVMVRDADWWYNAYITGDAVALFDVARDPGLEHNVAAQNPDVCGRLCDLACQDAGGEYPEYLVTLKGEPGCTPLLG
jgi:arylsulfatase A-like enzyme